MHDETGVRSNSTLSQQAPGATLATEISFNRDTLQINGVVLAQLAEITVTRGFSTKELRSLGSILMQAAPKRRGYRCGATFKVHSPPLLRARPEVAAAYGAVKWQLARRRCRRRDAYAEAKGPFVRGPMACAEAWARGSGRAIPGSATQARRRAEHQ